MSEFEEKRADPGYFVCYFCEKKIEGKVPADAWVKGVVSPHYRYICHGCRSGSPAKPRDEYYRCPDCDINIEIPEPERPWWRNDPEARIKLFDDGPKYVRFCTSCAAQRQLNRDGIERRRLTAERNSSVPKWQVQRIRELQVGYERERDTEGKLRYPRPEAIERAVWLEMLVADSARFPEFMSWLADHPADPLPDEAGEKAA